MGSLDGQTFRYAAAFDRNIGWLAEWEQQALRDKHVAIAGMGGVGGFHLLTLARMGVGGFAIADLDRFELANFNRQVGASMPSLGKPKVEVLAEMARGINPELRLKIFDTGVQAADIDAFLAGADLFIDGFDFFVMDMRRLVFQRCAELGIPALTAAPVGMGVGFIAFTPDSMGFEEYFRLAGKSELRQYVNFLLGMAPSGQHRAYLIDPTRLDFARKKAPSSIAGVQLAASVAATAGVQLLLRRGELEPAPMHHHYDAFLGQLIKTRLAWGNAGPLQRIKARAAERMFGRLAALPARPEPARPANWIEEIVDTARWTPSGDNSQPWRFRQTGPEELAISIADHSAENVYEYNGGQPTLLSAGMLLASLDIAASRYARRAAWRYVGIKNGSHRIDVQFVSDSGLEPDPLLSFVPLRSVDRRPYRLRRLTGPAKTQLQAALGPGLAITWHEHIRERMKIAGLNAAATDIRLRIPETYKIHSHIIDWRRRQSPEGIPAGALGLSRSTLFIMRWAMQSWNRLNRFNRRAGTFPAALQMDYLPGFFSAAHFHIRLTAARAEESHIQQLLRAGMGLQRFWLTATRLGLVMQPSLAPLAFAHWGGADPGFTTDPAQRAAAVKLARRAQEVLPGLDQDTVFLGRIGTPAGPGDGCRSTRLSFAQLFDA